jgi:uncharacterized lipoprotein YmbA
MKKLVVVLALLMSGCAAIKTTELILSEVVADYCKAPEAGRAIIQAQVHSVLDPNTIKIVCAADQQ